MKNQELAKILSQISDFLKMEDSDFRPFIYQRAANSLEALEESVDAIYKREGKKGLEKIPGVGKSIAESIEEYIKTGRIKYFEQLKKETPVDLLAISSVEGMGPRRVKDLYQKLKIRNLKDLEKAAKAHKISPLFGFGEKMEENILEGIEFLKRSKGRFLLGEILPEVEDILKKLKKLKEVEQISSAGSVRRMKETIGDVDILVTTKKADKVMDYFVKLPGVVKVWGKGGTKSSIRMAQGFDVDLRAVRKKSYGSALQYFTGSKEHNIATRRIAMSKGLKLSEYGLFRGKKMVAGWTESGIYKALGLTFIEPELREDQGEVEAAKAGKLPRVIGYSDIKGDLHCHSDLCGGADPISDLAKTAKDMGYEYIGISNHTKFLKIENGLDEKQLAKRNKEIDKLNEKEKGFKILKGAETNIMNDGSIDINDASLKELDYAMAGIHSSLKMDKETMTNRIIKAIKNPHIDIIVHPTGRLLKKRDEYLCDLDKIFRAAKQYNVALEINSSPYRLDLNDKNIRRAKEVGVKMAINTDSHQKDQMRLINLGIAQARRGWAEKKDIINTNSLTGLLKFFK